MSAIKQFQTFELADFQLFLTSVNKDHRVPLVVTIPPALRLEQSDMGINTYRANGVVSGAFEFTKPGVASYVRQRGESPQESRVANSGEWLVKAIEENSTFVCVLNKNPTERFYDYSLHPLARNESVTFGESDLGRTVFLVQGTVMVEGRQFTDIRHIQLSQPKEYTFTNVNKEPAFLVYVKEISYEDAVGLADLLYPDRTVEFPFIADRS